MLRRTVMALAALAALAGCPADPEPPKPPACTAAQACANGLVCAINTADASKNACVPCKKDGECAREEFCHPLERRCRVRPCFGDECATHDDCALGRFCVQGLCLSASASNADGCTVQSCAEGELCNEGQKCHPVNLVCEQDLGCETDTDCGEGLKCNVGAGTCDAACTPDTAVEVCGVKRLCDDGTCVDCKRDADCGAGLRCDPAKRICESFTSCLSDADCEIPLVCNRLTRECTQKPPPCLSAEDCGEGETCQLTTGRCIPAGCQKDRFEANDALADAKALALGSTPNLTVCSGDVDFFKIDLGAGDRLQAVVEMDTLLPFEVAILSGTGEVAAIGEFAADAVANVPGTYYVRARSTDQFVRYALRLTVSRGVACPPDRFEANEDYLTARELSAGDEFGLRLCPRDQDWFVVGVERGQTLEVQLESTPTDGDLDLFVYDANGTRELGKSATAAEAESVSTAAFTGNRVFVRIVGATPGTQNVYDLLVRLRGP